MAYFEKSLEQVRFLIAEIRPMIHKKPWRLFSAIFHDGIWVNIRYRFGRALYLVPGGNFARIILSPILFLIRPWIGNTEIHYGAEIGPGLRVAHPSLGVVVSKHAIIGKNFRVIGGSVIGGRGGSGRSHPRGSLVIGDDVTVGTSAVILGPVRVGNRVNIGAGAVVIHDCPDDCTVAGVPAMVVHVHRPLAAGGSDIFLNPGKAQLNECNLDL